MTRRLLMPALGLAAAPLAPASARAAEAFVIPPPPCSGGHAEYMLCDPPQIRYTAQPGEANRLTISSAELGRVRFQDTAVAVGPDRLTGDAGDNVLAGGRAADVIAGGPGDDNVEGGRGRDQLAGDAGDDALEAGSERMYAGALRLGSGEVIARDGGERVSCGEGRDRVEGRDDVLGPDCERLGPSAAVPLIALPSRA